MKPLTPRKYTVLNGNFVFDFHYVFQEIHNTSPACIYFKNTATRFA